MLVVGEAGLGKTTFVRNLFAAYARDPSFPVLDARGAGPETQKVLARVCLWGCGVGGPRETRVWGGTRPALPSPQPYRAPTDSRPHPPSFDTHVHPHTQTHTRDQVFAEHPERLCTEIVLQDADSKIWWHYLVQASCWEESWRGGGGGGRACLPAGALSRVALNTHAATPLPRHSHAHTPRTPLATVTARRWAPTARVRCAHACWGEGEEGRATLAQGDALEPPLNHPLPYFASPLAPFTHTNTHTLVQLCSTTSASAAGATWSRSRWAGGCLCGCVRARVHVRVRCCLRGERGRRRRGWRVGGRAPCRGGGGGGAALLALPPPHTHTLTRPPRPSLNAHTGPRAPAGHARHPGHARGRVPLLSGAPPPAPGTRACACVPLLSRAPAPAPGVRLPLLPPNQPHAHPLTPPPHTHRWTWCSCGSWRGRSP